MELKLNHVSKQFHSKLAVHDVTVSFQSGIIGILGANGSGKTTLLRMIVDVLQSTNGSILWNGIDIHEQIESYLCDIGYLPQHIGMYPDFKVMDYLMYMGALKGLKKSYCKERAELLLKQLHLYDQKKKRIKTLSGGMRQRLAIAQCLLNDPTLIVLDEPTVGLDPKERNQFAQLLSDLAKDHLILLSTHIVSDIEYIANQIMIMKEGSVIAYGAKEQLLEVLQGKIVEEVVPIGSRVDGDILIQRPCEEGIKIRYISDCPKISQSVKATLNDLYLYYFQEESL